MSKKKLIVSYKKLSQELLDTIAEAYPEGFEHLIKKFPKNAMEHFYAFPFETDDASYLIKVDVLIDGDSDDSDSDNVFDIDIPTPSKEVLKADFDDEDEEEEEPAYDSGIDDDDEEDDDEDY